MTTVIVLGMHRTRTSLVSRICVELGVNMGDDLLGTHPSQPHGHWEDKEFYQLNQRILQGVEMAGSGIFHLRYMQLSLSKMCIRMLLET